MRTISSSGPVDREEFMLSKCANPECAAPFHYLREGKLFQIELRNGAPVPPGPQLVGKQDERRVEHFWLCGPCSENMTLAFAAKQGMVVIPLKKQPAMRRAAAS
jgi:hypothetical protein